METIKGIVSILSKEYDHEVEDIPRSREFCRHFRKYVSESVRPYGLTLVPECGHCYCYASGDVVDSQGRIVRFVTSDYRYDTRWKDSILVYLYDSKNCEQLFRCYCSLEHIGETIAKIFERDLNYSSRGGGNN